MAFYQFQRKQLLNASLDDVWDFIATPANLSRITPPAMGFDILTPNLPEQMYPGMIIHYRVKPMPFYITEWVTEITHIKPGAYFVDEQRVGPYALWHHEHHVKQVNGGVEMVDIVSYVPPFKWIGGLANWLFINKQLNNIFKYRTKALDDFFLK
ncbi:MULTISPECIES: SRPBCC family protein [unclassified Carboxylicivirga]|uniref:SRPBCC family protein n=1 Tax=Carboxylicivirga TaxID=1628153 RepID=UPI003D34EB27